jgi:hypothetical protein
MIACPDCGHMLYCDPSFYLYCTFCQRLPRLYWLAVDSQLKLVYRSA